MSVGMLTKLWADWQTFTGRRTAAWNEPRLTVATLSLYLISFNRITKQSEETFLTHINIVHVLKLVSVPRTYRVVVFILLSNNVVSLSTLGIIIGISIETHHPDSCVNTKN
jgi:hypothetical protein